MLGQIQPYSMEIEVEGVTRILFHRYDPQEAEDKANAPKGSRRKKSDNIMSYLYVDEEGYLCFPAVNIKASLLNAAKWFSDPRSSGQKKQAKELFTAKVFVVPEMPRFLVGGRPIKEPQFIDRRGVCVQRNRVNRERPGLLPGWRCCFQIQVVIAEYISPNILRDVVEYAGRFVGWGDFRPDFGRFQVVRADLL